MAGTSSAAQTIDVEKKELQSLLKENERLKKEMEVLINKERHDQQVELLKQQNNILRQLDILTNTESKLSKL